MKTICIYHKRDLDGWMSAAIVKKYYDGASYCSVCEKPLPKHHAGSTECCGGITTSSEPKFLGWDYGDDIPDLSGYDKVIMVDVAFIKGDDASEMYKLISKLIWIDHHASAIKTMKEDMLNNSKSGASLICFLDTKFAACELTWQYLFPDDKMPEVVRLLGMYDSFRHKGTDEEQKVLKFQYFARSRMSNYEECYNIGLDRNLSISLMLKEGEAIYRYLCTEARQTYKKAFPIEFRNMNLGRGKTRLDTSISFLCVNQERFNPVNFGINYHEPIDNVYFCIENTKKYGLLRRDGTFTSNSSDERIVKYKLKEAANTRLEKLNNSDYAVVDHMWTNEGYDGFACFWLKDGKWSWSLYNDNGKVDCSIIAKQYDGGGHKGAAGMVINTERMIEIIKNID